jgi:predicted AlkP superfamily pyrophosphatase or phosphodiesterase
MKNLSALESAPACCVYPSISRVNAAAMVTGVRPERSGIDRWEKREIRTDDAVSLALCNGVSAAWIDGPHPPVLLRRGIIRINDTNGDGSFDDEITDRAIADYDNGTRLLYVHLFDTDRSLHAYGPYSSPSLDSAARADVMIGHIVGRIRPGTLLLVVSDHGGHNVPGDRGDHGSLLPQDMLIPLAVRFC